MEDKIITLIRLFGKLSPEQKDSVLAIMEAMTNPK